ncbi:chorismate mutase [Nostoc sp.]|uniref:chorismate mutase n=1 Tax=Nostoc sp. TaxID=1180 RepID=UPI003FA551ED
MGIGNWEWGIGHRYRFRGVGAARTSLREAAPTNGCAQYKSVTTVGIAYATTLFLFVKNQLQPTDMIRVTFSVTRDLDGIFPDAIAISCLAWDDVTFEAICRRSRPKSRC